MLKNSHKICVTGGAGFIGSEFVRQAVNKYYHVSVIDNLTYAGDLKRLDDVKDQITFYQTDITDLDELNQVIRKEAPYCIVHFAAETHVDRSLLNLEPFIKTNINGVQNLINAAAASKVKRFIHISTDEIYGPSETGKFKEASPINPSNPYAATKAAGELLIKSACNTGQLKAIIARSCNVYGPWQYPEKLIPVAIYKLLKDQKAPIYGKGEQIREWLHVKDCVEAINTLIKEGVPGEIYNIGSGFEQKNLKTVKTICKYLKKTDEHIKFIKDRTGHDFRYTLDFKKMTNLKWQPLIKFTDGIQQTIKWNEENFDWLNQSTNNEMRENL